MIDMYEGKPGEVVHYGLGNGRVMFKQDRERGRGRELMIFHLRVETILALAEVFRGVPVEQRGHAFWHSQHPEAPAPCAQCAPYAGASHGLETGLDIVSC